MFSKQNDCGVKAMRMALRTLSLLALWSPLLFGSLTHDIPSCDTARHFIDSRCLGNHVCTVPELRFDESPLPTSSITASSQGGPGVRTAPYIKPYTADLEGAEDGFQRPPQAVIYTGTGSVASLALAYDTAGNVVSRAVSGGPTQALTWDAWGRLVGVSVTSSGAYTWGAVYDGLGRRVQTSWNGSTSLTYYYDPQVEFLQLGLNNGGSRQWNVYGPDTSGVYGGEQGTGGLENTVTESNSVNIGMFNNYFGDAVGNFGWLQIGPGSYATSGISSYPAQGSVMGGYGTVVGSFAQQLLPEWRGEYTDYTGLIYVGRRYYDSWSARWLSPDPFGHAVSLSLYDYCAGDPVNGLDPTGMFGVNPSADSAGLSLNTQANNMLYNGPDYSQGQGIAEQVAQENQAATLFASLVPILPQATELITGQGFASGQQTSRAQAGLDLLFASAALIPGGGLEEDAVVGLGEQALAGGLERDAVSSGVISAAEGAGAMTEKGFISSIPNAADTVVPRIAGSGPASGYLEVSDAYASSKAVQNFSSSTPKDFIFDPNSGRFVMGRGPFGHDSILEAARITPSESTVGGTIWRENGNLMTNEWSGHYGQNWTPEIRAQYLNFMQEQGVDITHIPWGQ
jgi:RHS repeat-associated protein